MHRNFDSLHEQNENVFITKRLEWMAAFYSFDWMKANIFISLSLFCHCQFSQHFDFPFFGITMMHLSQCNSWDIVVGLVRLNIGKYCRCSGNNDQHSILNKIAFIHIFIVSCRNILLEVKMMMKAERMKNL